MVTLLYRRLDLGCIALIVCAPVSSSVASAGEDWPDRVLRAGAAVADITPPLGERRVGDGTLPVTAIHDRLHARCLVLDNGQAQIAFVICDNIGIGREIYDQARRLIGKETKLPPANILMAATHTHSATRASSDKYQPRLVRGIADAVRRAVDHLAPAIIGWGGVDEPSEVFNRRWRLNDPELLKNPFGGVDKVRSNPPRGDALVEPAGPVDPEIFFVSVRAPDGRPIALLANYSLHYVAGSRPADVSADYFGVFANRIGELLGAKSGEAPFVGMLSNGTSGDVNNINRRKRAESYPRYEKMNEVAERVARRVKEAHDRIECRDWVLLGSAHRELKLKVRKPDAQMRRYLAEILFRPAGAQKYHPAEQTYAGRVQRLLEGPGEITIPLQAVRIGDIGIAAIPFEVFAEIGLEIKEKAPFADAFTIELANDCHGYLPTPRQHELGGYETWMGPNKVQEDASVIIVGQLLEMFAELAR